MEETQEMLVQLLGREDPLEEGMATHFSILAWRILCTEEPRGLQSMGSPRVRRDSVTKHATHCFKYTILLHAFLLINVYCSLEKESLVFHYYFDAWLLDFQRTQEIMK